MATKIDQSTTRWDNDLTRGVGTSDTSRTSPPGTASSSPQGTTGTPPVPAGYRAGDSSYEGPAAGRPTGPASAQGGASPEGQRGPMLQQYRQLAEAHPTRARDSPQAGSEPTGASATEGVQGNSRPSQIGAKARPHYTIGENGLPSFKTPIDPNPETNAGNIKLAVAAGCDYLWNAKPDAIPGLNEPQRKMLSDIQSRLHSTFKDQDAYTLFKWGEAHVESGNGRGFKIDNGKDHGMDGAFGLFQMVPSQMNGQKNPPNPFPATEKQLLDPTLNTFFSEVRTQWFAEQGFSRNDPYGMYHGIGKTYTDTSRAYGNMMAKHDWSWTPGQGTGSERMWALDPRALKYADSG